MGFAEFIIGPAEGRTRWLNPSTIARAAGGTMSEADAAAGLTEPSLDLGAYPASFGAGYRVLARKYRPATFEDLIGQEAMVRTLSNAFEAGRIPQAWILTGVRGVGKTTTARILARGLNYELPDGSVKAPTIQMPVLGMHCAAIMESRHVDVLEMDAASHNGVDDIRQINDAIRYAPVNARYKVYILDEVHMLSNQAFNALLKTLEEPPPHAKFVFATTEIREVPITVLSRCQRFDLRRVDADRLVKHLEGILAKENVAAEPEALALIARAAEGSVRDSLSLLDQAISHAAGSVRAEDVRQMLGLADNSRIIALFEALMRGDIAAALRELRDQYDSGADPLIVMTELAAFTHFVTRVKIVPTVAEDRALAEVERKRGRDFAADLSIRVLSRTWQMLLKGTAEVKEAARPVAAAEMVLVRIAYAADLPSPEDVIRSLGDISQRPATQAQGNGAPALSAPTSSGEHVRASGRQALAPSVAPPSRAPMSRGEASPAAAQFPRFAQFTELIAFVGEQRDLQLKSALERDVRLVRFEDGKLEIALEPGASKTLIGDLGRRLTALTGRRWMVAVSAEPGEPTVRSQLDARHDAFRRGVQADPRVQSVLARFPGAEIVAVRQPELEATPPVAAGDDDELPDLPAESDESSFGTFGPRNDVDGDL
jgi:DNA polymerase III subunit gamma/tau